MSTASPDPWCRPGSALDHLREDPQAIEVSDLVASGFARDEGALPIRANARLPGAMLKAGERIWQALSPSRCAYLVVASGRIEVNGEPMGPLDGAAITKVPAVEIIALEDSGLVMVDTGQV